MLQPKEAPTAAAALRRVSAAAARGQSVLHDVSFEVRRGEILSLLGTGGLHDGPSGIGTALALVAGFARADAGHVEIGGRLMDATLPHRRDVGMVSRRLALFAHLDVVGHARFARGVTPAQADAILRRLEITAFARRRPASLSPDTRFRVALARALAQAPKILLLEEPVGVAHAGAGWKPLLRSIAAETGLAILHATEDAAACFGFSDRIGVVQSGRLRQLGAPQELYERPDSLAAALAMGPINRLAGTVLDLDDDIARIRLAGGALVEARFVEALQPGEACVVALRPERIAIAAVVASEMGQGAVAAKLVDTVFEGAQMRLRFSLDTKAGAAPDVLVVRPAGAALPRGNTISLAWQAHHAVAFRTEAA